MIKISGVSVGLDLDPYFCKPLHAHGKDGALDTTGSTVEPHSITTWIEKETALLQYHHNTMTYSENSIPKLRQKQLSFTPGKSWEIPPKSIRVFKSRIGILDNGCKIFKGATTKWGHVAVRIRLNGTHVSTLAHRIAWFLEKGPIENGKIVCHRCPNGNANCVNTDHLYIGTDADNNRDCESAGRGNHPKREMHGRTLLNEEKVSFIRKSYKPRSRQFSCPALARMLNVSQSAVRHVINGRNWKTN